MELLSGQSASQRANCHLSPIVATEINWQHVKDEPLPTPNAGWDWLDQNPPKTLSAGEVVVEKTTTKKTDWLSSA